MAPSKKPSANILRHIQPTAYRLHLTKNYARFSLLSSTLKRVYASESSNEIDDLLDAANIVHLLNLPIRSTAALSCVNTRPTCCTLCKHKLNKASAPSYLFLLCVCMCVNHNGRSRPLYNHSYLYQRTRQHVMPSRLSKRNDKEAARDSLASFLEHFTASMNEHFGLVDPKSNLCKFVYMNDRVRNLRTDSECVRYALGALSAAYQSIRDDIEKMSQKLNAEQWSSDFAVVEGYIDNIGRNMDLYLKIFENEYQAKSHYPTKMGSLDIKELEREMELSGEAFRHADGLAFLLRADHGALQRFYREANRVIKREIAAIEHASSPKAKRPIRTIRARSLCAQNKK